MGPRESARRECLWPPEPAVAPRETWEVKGTVGTCTARRHQHGNTSLHGSQQCPNTSKAEGPRGTWAVKGTVGTCTARRHQHGNTSLHGSQQCPNTSGAQGPQVNAPGQGRLFVLEQVAWEGEGRRDPAGTTRTGTRPTLPRWCAHRHAMWTGGGCCSRDRRPKG